MEIDDSSNGNDILEFRGVINELKSIASQEFDQEHIKISPLNNINSNIDLTFESVVTKMCQILTYDLWNNTDETIKNKHFDVMKRCSLLWNASKTSPIKELIQRIFSEPLITPNIEKWSTLYDALKQILTLKDKFEALTDILGQQNSLRDTDFSYISNFIQCTEPLASAIDIMRKEIQFGYLIPVLLNLIKKLQSLYSEFFNSRNRFSSLVDAQLKALQSKFSDILLIKGNVGIAAAMAAFFHPKFKAKWLKRFSETEQTRVRNLIIEVATHELSETTTAEEIEQTNSDSLDDFLKFSQEYSAIPTFEFSDIHLQITNFCKDSRTNLEILKEYPKLFKLFCKYNSVPLTSNVLLMKDVYCSMPIFLNLSETEFESIILYKINRI